jgi:hypothetical protein
VTTLPDRSVGESAWYPRQTTRPMSRSLSPDVAKTLQLLQQALQSTVQPQRRVDLPEVCDKLGLPPSPDDPELTKAKYIASRYPSKPELIRESARRFVDMFPLSQGHHIAFELEESLWSAEHDIRIPLKSRHEIARALSMCELFSDFSRFLQGLERLFPIKSSIEDLLAIPTPGRSENPIVQHMLRNNDWGAWELFDHLNAFDVSDRRFSKLIEFLASPEIHASDERQSQVVAAVVPSLRKIGLDLTDEIQESGYPAYTVASLNRGVRGRPKNIIFASRRKPDIIIDDGISNDIELASGATTC